VKRIRVAIVGPSLDIMGGQAVQAARLIEELKKLPEVEVSFQPVNPRLPGPLSTLQRIKYVRTVFTESVYLAQLLLRTFECDILHLFSAGYWSFLLAPAPGIVFGRLFGRKTILNYRDGQAEDHLTKFPRAVRLMQLTDRIVPPSGFLVDVFGRFNLRAEPIFNIIDSGQFPFRERPNPRPHFFHNRGMEPVYNVPCTIRAFARIQEKYPNARLTLAHDGPLRSELERLVADLKLRHVEFVGKVSQSRMRELYNQADLYLMSPNLDNMPGSVLECFACGLPLVSTNAGGVPYIVENERTGLLVPLDDDAAMARAAFRLLEEPGLALGLAANGYQECERYRGPVIANQWLRLYRTLAAN
jgi:glycosyltransferase involved in cell wall biosynthesis